MAGVNYIDNARRYWREHAVHVAVGALAGGLLMAGGGEAAAGATLIALATARQALEYAKRDDTPGIDLAYHMAGLIGGILIGWWF